MARLMAIKKRLIITAIVELKKGQKKKKVKTYPVKINLNKIM
jgi:hypothetical protein